MFCKSKVLTSLALGLAIVSGHAGASARQKVMLDAEGSRYVKVGIADLNLATAPGVNTLHRRLRVAAEQVCGQVVSGTRWLPDDVKQCEKSAIAAAMRTLEHKSLAQPQIDVLALTAAP